MKRHHSMVCCLVTLQTPERNSKRKVELARCSAGGLPHSSLRLREEPEHEGQDGCGRDAGRGDCEQNGHGTVSRDAAPESIDRFGGGTRPAAHT